MAAIMQEWQAILATAKRIADKTGVEVPKELQRMEGDIWARQAGRLRALSRWLRDLEKVLPAEVVELEPLPEQADEPKPAKPRKKKAAAE